ncbi:phospholipase, partial (plasmid) [Chromobacterium amazonense]|nr:phospholipase [Chromobacterium amazonense]
NWSGGYMDKSRNLEVVLRNEAMAQRIAALHEQTWSSPYAAPLDVSRAYQAPDKACRQAG